MVRTLVQFSSFALLSWCAFAQSSTPFKAYKTPEDYCRENPKMPTCVHIKPLKIDDLGLYKPPGIYNPTTTKKPASTVRPATARSEVQLAPGPAPRVALQDWRFSHPSPAMLLSINIGSLLRSPLLNTLFTASGATSADIDKARSALSDVGQVLISVASNGAESPAVLMLARGNVDGVLGALLRSGAGMEATRLDAITMLIGDPLSLRMANIRLRSALLRSTSNTLQLAATREALKYDAWIGVNPRHLTSIASAFGAGSTPGLSNFAILRGLSAGLYLRDQVRLEALLEATSPDLADRMLTAYERTEARKQNGQIWVTTEGAKVRYIEIVDAGRLKTIDAAATSLIGPQVAPLIRALAAAAPVQQSVSAAPAKPVGPIVIQGLAGGPKELPTK